MGEKRAEMDTQDERREREAGRGKKEIERKREGEKSREKMREGERAEGRGKGRERGGRKEEGKREGSFMFRSYYVMLLILYKL